MTLYFIKAKIIIEKVLQTHASSKKEANKIARIRIMENYEGLKTFKITKIHEDSK
jgi:hypothetical protein